MSNDDPNMNDEPQDPSFDIDPFGEDTNESTDSESVEFDNAAFDSSENDSAEFDSAEFDSAEFDPGKMDGSGTVGESESRDSEEIPIKGESESRESEEIPLVAKVDQSASATEGDDEEESEESFLEVPEPANEWVLATFFSGCGIYVVLGFVFFSNAAQENVLIKDIFLKPRDYGDWALALILSPIAFICFMSSCLALLSRPRGKQWFLLLPTLGPLVPIASGALAVVWLFFS